MAFINRKMDKCYCFDLVGRGAQADMGVEPVGVGVGGVWCGVVNNLRRHREESRVVHVREISVLAPHSLACTATTN